MAETAGNKVHFELVTPERVVVSEDYDLVVAPGESGNFGVLPGHAPLLSTLRPGVVEIFENNVPTERLFVAGGFAEVTEAGFTVLADEAVPVTEIDRAAAESRLEAAREAEAKAGTDDDEAARKATEQEIAVAEAMIAAAG